MTEAKAKQPLARLQLILKSCEYTTSQRYVLQVFVPRSFQSGGAIAVDVKLGEPVAVELQLQKTQLPSNIPLHVWLNAERPVIEDHFVDGKDNKEADDNPFSPRAPQSRHGMVCIGTARLSLFADKEAVVYHLSGHAAAHIECKLLDSGGGGGGLQQSTADPAYAWCTGLDYAGHVRMLVERPWTSASDGYIAAVEEVGSRYRDSNIRELERTTCARVELPCGDVPLWAFVWAPTHKRSYNHQENEALLIWWLSVASQAIRLHPDAAVDEKTPVPVLLELLGEVLAVYPRACLYAPDSFINEETHEIEGYDQWTYFDHTPDAPMLCYDCEDGAGFVHGLSHAVRDGVFKDKRLQRLQQFERQYYTFMALGTLALAGADGHVGHVYHAYTLKLDRRYVIACLGRKQTQSETGALLPPLLVESSGYSASCWQFDDREAERVKCFRASEFKEPMPARRKIPATLVRDSGRYVHTQTLVCAELTESDDIGQIEITYKGGIACPTEALMEYDSAVQMVAVPISKADKAVVLGAVEHLPAWSMPRAPRLEHTTPEELREMIVAEAAKPVPRLDCWFRGRDWTDSTGLRNLVSHRATKVTIKLTDQVTVVRVTLDC